MITNQQNYLGVDVSKVWFDVSVLKVIDHQKQVPFTKRFDNSSEGLTQFHKWLKYHHVTFDENTLIVIENTGIYHRLLWAYCGKHQIPLHIGNAAQIKWSFGIARGKSDVIDSLRLCQYACKEADMLKSTSVLDPTLLQLKDLMTARTRLITQRNAIKTALNELKGVNNPDTQKLLEKSHQDVLKGFEASIKKIQDAIKKIVINNEAIKKNYKLLTTVPGIGHITALYIIGCTNNFIDKVSGKQLACYAGVVPFENTSGSSVRGRKKVHKMGNKELKKLLYMGSMAAIQHHPEFKNYYERKKAEGKNNMSIINAIKNKLLLRAAAVVNNQMPYVDKTDFDHQKKVNYSLV